MRLIMQTGIINANIQKSRNYIAAPSFRYTDALGVTYSSDDLRGKVVFLNFWATWCPPCLAEMPSLNKLYLKFKSEKDIVFLFLNEDDNAEKATDFLLKKGYQWPLAFRNGEIAPELFGGSLPTTVIIDKKGSLVYHHTGMADFSSEKFEMQLKDLLNDK